MEEDDMVMRVGNSLRGKRDEPMRREGLQAQGSYKEVPRPSRGLALAAAKRSLTLFACTSGLSPVLLVLRSACL